MAELERIVLLLVSVAPHVSMGCLSRRKLLQVLGEQLLQAALATLPVHTDKAVGDHLLADVDLFVIGQSDKVDVANLEKEIQESVLEMKRILEIGKIKLLFQRVKTRYYLEDPFKDSQSSFYVNSRKLVVIDECLIIHGF